MARRDVIVGQIAVGTAWENAATNNLVYANNGWLYYFFVNSANDVVFRKSNNNGTTWSRPTVVYTGTAECVSIWYDRWSNISADLIHVCYIDSSIDDILYRTVNTASSDTLGTEVTVFAGISQAAGGALSITRAVGGNIIIAGSIDAGAEDGAWKSTDSGATWGATIADPSEASTQDQYMLLPDFNADTQDVQLIFWDASANALSVKRYDDSANTWTETSIATSMNDVIATTVFPSMAAFVDITNSQVVVAAWSGHDTAASRLRCWTVTNTTITAKTDIVSSSTDDQTLCAITIDTTTGYWYAFYCGKTDGSETVTTNLNIYYKVSTDAGSTWGAETLLTDNGTGAREIRSIWSAPRTPTISNRTVIFANDQGNDELYCSSELTNIESFY